MSDQLDVQRQLTEAIREQNDLLSQQLGLMREQVNLTRQMVGDMTSSYDEASASARTAQEDVNNLTASQREAALSVSDLRSRMEKYTDGAGSAALGTSKFGTSLGGLIAAGGAGGIAGFLKSLGGGLKGLSTGSAEAMMQLATSLAGTFGNLLTGIAELDAKAFAMLSDLADNIKGIFVKGVEQPMEDARAVFGQLEQGAIGLQLALGNVGVAFLDTSYFFAQGAENLALYFGTGVEGMKGFTDAVIEGFADLGPLFKVFGTDIQASVENNMIPMQVGVKKAFGASSEEMHTLATIAMAEGENLEQMLGQITQYSSEMAKAFKDSGTQVGKSVITMMSKIDTFHGLSAADLAGASSRIRDLGLDAKATGEMVKKFMNFDQTAESASMLSQAFGANVDVMKLMKSNNPAEILDELRTAMFAAGQTSENMSVQQLNLLARTTGLTAGQAKLAFSMKNRGKASEDYIGTQRTMESATFDMADAIESLVALMPQMIIPPEAKGAMKGWFDFMQTGVGDAIMSNNKFILGLKGMSEEGQRIYEVGLQYGNLANETNIAEKAQEALEARYSTWESAAAAEEGVAAMQDLMVAQQDVAEKQKEILLAKSEGTDSDAIAQMEQELAALHEIAFAESEELEALAALAGAKAVEQATTVVEAGKEVFGAVTKQAEVPKKAFEDLAKVIKDTLKPAVKDLVGVAEEATTSIDKLFKALPTEDAKFDEFLKKLEKAIEDLGAVLKDVDIFDKFEELSQAAASPLNEAAKNLEKAVQKAGEVKLGEPTIAEAPETTAATTATDEFEKKEPGKKRKVTARVEPGGGKATAKARVGDSTITFEILLQADAESLARVVAGPLAGPDHQFTQAKA